MRKIFGIILLLGGTAYSSELLPELNEFMVLEPEHDQYIEQNAYIGWAGLRYPQDNWQTVYREVFKQNTQYLNDQIVNGLILTNYFANPQQAILRIHSDSDALKDFGKPRHNNLQKLKDYNNTEAFLSFKQDQFENKRYRYTSDFFPCMLYLDDACIETMKERSDYVRKTLDKNSELVDRFQQLVKSSTYSYALLYNDFNSAFEVDLTSGMSEVIQLSLAKAVMSILAGDLDEGLEQLKIVRQWIDFMYVEKSQAPITHFFLNVSMTQFLDQTMNALLSSGLLNDSLSDPRLAFIMRLYPENIGRKLNEAILFNIKQDFKNFAYSYIRVYKSPKRLPLSFEDEYLLLSYLQAYGVILSPNLYDLYLLRADQAKTRSDWTKVRDLQQDIQTSDGSVYGLSFEDDVAHDFFIQDLSNVYLTQAEESYFVDLLNEWYGDYLEDLGFTLPEVLFDLNTKYPSIDFYNEYFAAIQTLELKENIQSHLTVQKLMSLFPNMNDHTMGIAQRMVDYRMFDYYWSRLYEQQNYHQLVYLKYLVMKNRIPAKDIPDFLKAQGSIVYNTMSHQPYMYNAKSGKLYTPLPRQSKHLPSNIKIIKLRDSNIKNFEVILPKY